MDKEKVGKKTFEEEPAYEEEEPAFEEEESVYEEEEPAYDEEEPAYEEEYSDKEKVGKKTFEEAPAGEEPVFYDERESDDEEGESADDDEEKEKIVSVPAFFEKLVEEYYNERYQEMKKVFQNSGLVQDIMNEVGKYNNLSDNRRVKGGKGIKDLYSYFHYHPFDADKYYEELVDIKGPYINSGLPKLLLPGCEEIFFNDESKIVYHGRECTAVGTAMYSYKNYIVVYKYNVDLHQEDYAGISEIFSSNYKRYNGYNNWDEYDAIYYIMRNLFTVEKKEEFDYMKFLKDSKTQNMGVIIPVLKFFSPNDEYHSNMGEIISYIEELLEEEKKKK
jgi:hypothetical protein